jgi:hypothetical protein
VKCDACQRQLSQERSEFGRKWAPDGWYVVEGAFGGGEPYDRYHACSLPCLAEWARRCASALTIEPF